MIIRARVRTLGVVVLVDSSGVRSMRWVVGVGAAGSVQGLVACPEGVPLLHGQSGVWRLSAQACRWPHSTCAGR